MISRFRPGGPTVAVRSGGVEVDSGGKRKSVGAGVNSAEGGEGPLINWLKDGPALRRSLNVVGLRRGSDGDLGAEVSVANVRVDVEKTFPCGELGGAYKNLILDILEAMLASGTILLIEERMTKVSGRGCVAFAFGVKIGATVGLNRRRLFEGCEGLILESNE